ncbi:hypothetical protein Tco_1315892 [Tanacetum coccineum]
MRLWLDHTPEPMKEDQTGSDSGKLHSLILLSHHYWSTILHQSTTSLQQITTSLPEITPFIALQLRVARLEQEMSEVKKTGHFADVLASIRSQVPTAIDNYLRTKLDDALLKSVKESRNLKRVLKELIKAKKEQDEEETDQLTQLGQQIKLELEELDQTKKRMDKEVADKVKDHKRKHDSDIDEDDDDEEGLQLNQTESEDLQQPKPEWTISLNDFQNAENKTGAKCIRHKRIKFPRVLEKLDHMVKDFHLLEYNKGMETRKWSEDDKRISKDFITAIEKRL